MEKLCSTPYSAVYIKQRLQELLGDRVIISNVHGKANVVTFNETSASILQAYHDKCKTSCDSEGEKERLIRTAVAPIASLFAIILQIKTTGWYYTDDGTSFCRNVCKMIANKLTIISLLKLSPQTHRNAPYNFIQIGESGEKWTA